MIFRKLKIICDCKHEKSIKSIIARCHLCNGLRAHMDHTDNVVEVLRSLSYQVIPVPQNVWYFGVCPGKYRGHFWWEIVEPGSFGDFVKEPRQAPEKFIRIDQTLADQVESNVQPQGLSYFGVSLDYRCSVWAFWDRSGDPRMGSISAFCFNEVITWQMAKEQAQIWAPQVFTRIDRRFDFALEGQRYSLVDQAIKTQL